MGARVGAHGRRVTSRGLERRDGGVDLAVAQAQLLAAVATEAAQPALDDGQEVVHGLGARLCQCDEALVALVEVRQLRLELQEQLRQTFIPVSCEVPYRACIGS